MCRTVFLCCRLVAEAEGIGEEYCMKRLMGARAKPELEQRHGRLAGALLLDLLIAGNSASSLEEQYGQPEQLSRSGELVVWWWGPVGADLVGK